jgi:hypothetical protein
VLYGCYICFAIVFQIFSRVFFASVSDTCFKCFVSLQTYVANILFRYFKSRSDITYVAIAPVACHHLPLSVNSLTRRPAPWLCRGSPVGSSSGVQPPKTTQSKGMAVQPPETTQLRGVTVRVWEAKVAQMRSTAGAHVPTRGAGPREAAANADVRTFER